jgi:DsbC/DsbD-like thiol-disulfide interchange protein
VFDRRGKTLALGKALPDTSPHDAWKEQPSMSQRRWLGFQPSRLILATVAAVATATGGDRATAAELASAWDGAKPESRSRLIAGEVGGKTVAGVQVELAPGWKTYWRFPGDAGGIPPTFDWSASINVAAATVLYPAPVRMSDRVGDTIGYTGTVTFPVRIEPIDASKPVTLALKFALGVCKDICIPVETELSLVVPATGRPPLPGAIAGALEKVPRRASDARASDPKLISATTATGDRPTLTIEVEFPGGASRPAVIVESAAGDYIPLPPGDGGQPSAENRRRFVIDLTGAADVNDIRGKPVVVTMISERSHAEATITVE